MHLRHIDPRSLEWKDAMLDETKPGVEPDEVEAEDREPRMAPSTDGERRAVSLSAPSR